MNRFTAMLAAIALSVPVVPHAGLAAEDPITAAIQAEIDRTMARLRLPDSPKPYFIAVTLNVDNTSAVNATLGSIVSSIAYKGAHIGVEIRVGDYKLDDSNFAGKQMYGGYSRLDWMLNTPIDGNTDVLKRAIWWSLDQAYKTAVENLKRKQAVLANKSTAPVADDFAKAPVLIFTSPELPQQVPALVEMEKTARRLSAIMQTNTTLRHSDIAIAAGCAERWFVNTEGTKIHHVTPFATLSAAGTAQADDGVMVGDSIEFVARAYDKLPAVDKIASEVTALGARVEQMRAAPIQEDFAGPMLFEGPAAAQLCARILPKAFSSRRLPIVEDEQMARWLQSSEQESLRRKIGRRVMATGFTVTDDPTLVDFNGQPLMGCLPVDLEGVKPEKVTLVKNGILKTLLTTRTPDKKLPVSNGHATAAAYDYGMGGENVAAGITSLFVTYENGLTGKALYDKLIQTIKEQDVEYGLLIKRMPQRDLAMDGVSRRDSGNEEKIIEEPLYAWRVYPDGRAELVRVVALKGMNLAAFKDVLAAGKDLYVGQSSGEGHMTSIVCPSILFEEGVVVKPDRNVSKPPILPSPLLAR